MVAFAALPRADIPLNDGNGQDNHRRRQPPFRHDTRFRREECGVSRLLPCALLTDEPLTLRNLPRLADIDSFQHLMNQFGVSTVDRGHSARRISAG